MERAQQAVPAEFWQLLWTQVQNNSLQFSGDSRQLLAHLMQTVGLDDAQPLETFAMLSAMRHSQQALQASLLVGKTVRVNNTAKLANVDGVLLENHDQDITLYLAGIGWVSLAQVELYSQQLDFRRGAHEDEQRSV